MMSGRNKWTEQTDYVSSRTPKRRKVDLEFDVVQYSDETKIFVFYRDRQVICIIRRDFFSEKQADFFVAIAQP